MAQARHFIERSRRSALSFIRDALFSEEYAARPGLLQARDPRAASFGVLILLLCVLFSRSILALVVLYALCLALVLVSRIPLLYFFKRTWIFIPLFSLVIAVPALFGAVTPGDPVTALKLPGLTLIITRQGIASAAFFFLRVLNSVSLCALLILTVRHWALMRVMRCAVPQIFVMTVGMCYRYLFLLVETVENTFTAIKSRVGFVSRTRTGQRVVAWNIASLWQRSYYLHEDIYRAMLSRGYRGEPVAADEFKMKRSDWLWLLVALVTAAGVVWLAR